jgi:ABC-type dipeptide/oligopeptide/nickel transport system permease subunit
MSNAGVIPGPIPGRPVGLSSASATTAAQFPEAPSQWAIFWTAFMMDRPAVIGLAVIVLTGVVSLTVPLFSPYDPTVPIAGIRLAPPLTPGHLLGGDGQERDELSRLLWGGRISLVVSIVPIVVATVISLALGLVAGYYGGILDTLIMRTLDVFFAFPSVLIAIAIAAALGPNERNQMMAITILLVPYISRVVRTAVLSIKGLLHIEASRALGAGDLRIIVRHILPNAFPAVLIYATTLVGMMMVLASGLSFLGLGVQPPTPDWGVMVKDGKDVLGVAPWVTTLPGLAILILALAFTFVGDALRDALDPALRSRRAARAQHRREVNVSRSGWKEIRA